MSLKLSYPKAPQIEGNPKDAERYIRDLIIENNGLRELLNDENYIRWRADYAKGHLSWGNMIAEREAKANFIRTTAGEPK